jgi:DeoR/GlpR family transcriptional regulator of sugar metabolism
LDQSAQKLFSEFFWRIPVAHQRQANLANSGDSIRDRILDLLGNSDALANGEIAEKLGVSAGNITQGLKDLVAEGKVVGVVQNGTRFRLRPSRYRQFFDRSQQQSIEKRAIGQTTVDVIYGGRASLDASLNDQREQILSQFQGRTLAALKVIYQRRERTLYLDGGSSTLSVAENLKVTPLPCDKLKIWNVEVITNSPPVVTCLADYADSPEVILIGGRMQSESLAIAGHLADEFMRRTDLLADFAVIGCVAMDLHRGFGATTEDEAHLKSSILQRARVRIVVMDSTKDQMNSPVTFSFAPVSSDAVDILISDDAIISHAPFCAELKARGIQLFCPQFLHRQLFSEAIRD